MKNSVCFFELSSARPSPRSSALPAYLVAILLTLGSLVSPALASPTDSPAGSVHGTVLVISPDGRSHVAPGAQIRLIGATRDASQLALADDSGQYKFDAVRPGGYQLEVALDSFEKVAKPITIRAGETTVEDVKLEFKGARDEVIVKAERVGLNLRDAVPATESTAGAATCSDREPKFPGHTDTKRERIACKPESTSRRQRRGTLQHVQPKLQSTLRERPKPNGPLTRIPFAKDVGLEKLPPPSQPQG